MAIKGDRNIVDTDVSFFMDQEAERGGVVCLYTGGSGAAMDSAVALVTYNALPSGKVPLGILLNDVVDIDQTRQAINKYKDEVQKGGKVTILRRGYVVTDQILTGVTPAAGNAAYLNVSGQISNVCYTGDTSTSAQQLIGQFLSSKDSDGYAKVYVNLPLGPQN